MALQPAAGARDLNPQQVESNHNLGKRLAQVYNLWGYEEVSPPRIERLETLMAGGAIESSDIVKLVSDEPLGLRPEMTVSIARAACTRLAQRPRPLRLWAEGTVFVSKIAPEGGLSIEETLQSGVELFGISSINAEMELISLLLSSLEALELKKFHRPTLLLGHTGIMDLILSKFQDNIRKEVKSSLINFDRLKVEKLDLEEEDYKYILEIMDCRGEPQDVIKKLKMIFGKDPLIEDLKRLFEQLIPLAKEQGLTVQLDPTFQPHFKLYTGLVFQLICQGGSTPVVIAKGGRYDELVNKCGGDGENSSGAGFSFSIDEIRELPLDAETKPTSNKKVLIAYSSTSSLEKALYKQRELHKKGIRSLVELESCGSIKEAIELKDVRVCSEVEWLND